MNQTKPEPVTCISQIRCPVCSHEGLEQFFEKSSVPVFCNVLWSSKTEAESCAKGDIKLAFCPKCSHITNISFDPSLVNYTESYDNSLDFSPRFRTYSQSLAKQLFDRYHLDDADVVEIGCGKGAFLSMLCDLGDNRGTGFDPAVCESELSSTKKTNVRLIKDYYSERYADYRSDLFICRQMLEHVFKPTSFVKMLRETIGNRVNTGVFFEVPNALNIFFNLFIWDIIYEHYSYFTPISLRYIFASNCFQVCEVGECFENQFLCLHALPSDRSDLNFGSKQIGEVNNIQKRLASFGETCKTVVEAWNRKLQLAYEKGRRVVLWGSGSKGVSFLNAFKDSHIEYAVDINPEKQGRFVAGTGQQIVSPEFLVDYKPDIVIVMNPIYEREIFNYLKKLDLPGQTECLSPLSL